jgi:hypothetical protein
MAETLTHVWRRSEWTAEAEAALGNLIRGQRARILAEIEDGTAQVFQVEGPEYRGWLALRFEHDPDGLAMRAIAVRGAGAARWLADLRKMAANAGAEWIILHAEDDAHVRLYNRLGFRVDWADMRIAANGL